MPIFKYYYKLNYNLIINFVFELIANSNKHNYYWINNIYSIIIHLYLIVNFILVIILYYIFKFINLLLINKNFYLFKFLFKNFLNLFLNLINFIFLIFNFFLYRHLNYFCFAKNFKNLGILKFLIPKFYLYKNKIKFIFIFIYVYINSIYKYLILFFFNKHFYNPFFLLKLILISFNIIKYFIILIYYLFYYILINNLKSRIKNLIFIFKIIIFYFIVYIFIKLPLDVIFPTIKPIFRLLRLWIYLFFIKYLIFWEFLEDMWECFLDFDFRGIKRVIIKGILNLPNHFNINFFLNFFVADSILLYEIEFGIDFYTIYFWFIERTYCRMTDDLILYLNHLSESNFFHKFLLPFSFLESFYYYYLCNLYFHYECRFVYYELISFTYDWWYFIVLEDEVEGTLNELSDFKFFNLIKFLLKIKLKFNLIFNKNLIKLNYFLNYQLFKCNVITCNCFIICDYNIKTLHFFNKPYKWSKYLNKNFNYIFNYNNFYFHFFIFHSNYMVYNKKIKKTFYSTNSSFINFVYFYKFLKIYKNKEISLFLLLWNRLFFLRKLKIKLNLIQFLSKNFEIYDLINYKFGIIKVLEFIILNSKTKPYKWKRK